MCFLLILLFKVSDRITESGPELQSICKRAASEVVVRQALSELEQWEVQTRFILTEHQDSQRTTIMLIKDFKDILNKVCLIFESSILLQRL